MERVTLLRQLYPHGPFVEIATYGQPEEFSKALPGLLGPLDGLLEYHRHRGLRHDIIEIEKRMVDGTVSKERYKVTGLGA